VARAGIGRHAGNLCRRAAGCQRRHRQPGTQRAHEQHDVGVVGQRTDGDGVVHAHGRRSAPAGRRSRAAAPTVQRGCRSAGQGMGQGPRSCRGAGASGTGRRRGAGGGGQGRRGRGLARRQQPVNSGRAYSSNALPASMPGTQRSISATALIMPLMTCAATEGSTMRSEPSAMPSITSVAKRSPSRDMVRRMSLRMASGRPVQAVMRSSGPDVRQLEVQQRAAGQRQPRQRRAGRVQRRRLRRAHHGEGALEAGGDQVFLGFVVVVERCPWSAAARPRCGRPTRRGSRVR
jgi:hypothetical protein